MTTTKARGTGYQCVGCGDYFPKSKIQDIDGEYYCKIGMGHNAARIVVTRAKQYATPGRSYQFAWKWLYSYAVNGAPAVTYGTHLASLRGMLKRKFPGCVIVEPWK